MIRYYKGWIKLEVIKTGSPCSFYKSLEFGVMDNNKKLENKVTYPGELNIIPSRICHIHRETSVLRSE